MSVVDGFRTDALVSRSLRHVATGTQNERRTWLFRSVSLIGCTDDAKSDGNGTSAHDDKHLNWVNTMLGNVKNARIGTCRAMIPKHWPRYLAEVCCFNRLLRLDALVERLGRVALLPAPLP